MIKIFVLSAPSGLKLICPGYYNIRQKAKNENVKTLYIFFSKKAKQDYFYYFQKYPDNWKLLSEILKRRKMQEVFKNGSEGEIHVEDTIEDLVPHIKKSLANPDVKYVNPYHPYLFLLAVAPNVYRQAVSDFFADFLSYRFRVSYYY